MDREAWHTAVHGVAKSQTRLNWTFVYLIYISLTIVKKSLGFQGGSEVKKITCQCRRCRWCGFNPWIGKIPWRRAWQSILAWRIPIDRGAWQATVHGVADTTEQLSTHNISGQGWASSSLLWGGFPKRWPEQLTQWEPEVPTKFMMLSGTWGQWKGWGDLEDSPYLTVFPRTSLGLN